MCGDRLWTDRDVIERRLKRLPSGTIILHGDARGADRLAGEIAQNLGFEVKTARAEWDRGKSAGILRNRLMLDQNPSLVIAFHNNIAASKGTGDCVREARRRGITVEILTAPA